MTSKGSRIIGKTALVLTLSVLSMLVAACGDVDRTAYSHFEKIPSSGWDPADIIVFEPWPADSAEAAIQLYDMELVLRNTVRKPLARLPIALNIEDENGTLRSDTIIIGDPKGPQMRSKERYGVCETVLPLEKGLKLSEGFAVTVSPLSDAESSSGLLNIGIRLTRATPGSD